MAKETLVVPEQHLFQVIYVIRLGLGQTKELMPGIKPEVVEQLTKWCDEGEEYLFPKERKK